MVHMKKPKKPIINSFGAFPVPKPKPIRDYEDGLSAGAIGIAKKLMVFFEEKEIPYKVLEVKDTDGNVHMIDTETIMGLIQMAPDHEIRKVYEAIVYLDFRNANILDYLAHLAKCYISTAGFGTFIHPQDIKPTVAHDIDFKNDFAERERREEEAAFMSKPMMKADYGKIERKATPTIAECDNPFA
jgi:hypothetical protein